MIVKVCGMREPDNIRAVEQTGPDWMGFIFFPHSSRHVSLRPAYLPERCKRVGVFVNEVTPAILQKAEEFDLHYIQLHGTETSEQCLNLKRAGLGVIKVFLIASMSDLKSTVCYENVCDYFLFDTACTGYGGSGKTFDWQVLTAYHGSTPFLLSGGLKPDSLHSLKEFRHPAWAGIDLNSGFEISPGKKDTTLLNTFIKQIKSNIE